MANLRNLGEASRLITFGQGTFINGATGGTVNGAELGKFEYHSVIFAGTFANNGTINVYAATSASGSNPHHQVAGARLDDNPWACIDVKSSAIGSLNSAQGSTYTHLGVYGTVESGGTWRGALFILSTSPRQQVPGTTGLGTSAGGTSYYGTYLT
jgi:hypothetical protein